jgi:hypothetical protein
VFHNYDWNRSGAEREFKLGIQLIQLCNRPPLIFALLNADGHSAESLAEAMRAHELDPLSPFINNGLARQYFLTRQYDKTIAQSQKALES